MLGPQDVGYRVVVRHVVGVRDGRPLLTDVLGELSAWTGTEATVQSRKGPVAVPIATIVAGKRIPPRRPPGAAEPQADAGDGPGTDAGEVSA